MRTRQKQRIEAYERAQAFLESHPPSESPAYLAQKRELDEVVAALQRHTTGQSASSRLGRAGTVYKRALVTELREQHLTPIAHIARALLAEAPGIEKALKMPDYYMSPLRLVAEAMAIREAAWLYEAQFIHAGRPQNFLEQLDAAIEALREAIRAKEERLGEQVGSSAGIAADIKRGRRVIDVLDTIVKDAFRDDGALLAEWRNAKRVRARPGGAGRRSADGAATSDVTPLRPTSSVSSVA